jgi:AraC-like DNA-binding protein
MSIDLGLRGAVVGLCLLIAGLALRDRRDSVTARLGAALAVSAAASAIISAPDFPRPWQWWSLILLAISSSGTVTFWLWARATFDDDFVVRRWHAALLAAIVGLQIFVAGWTAKWPALGLAIDRTLSLAYLGLALLAVAQTLATWQADLMAGRRRLRLVVLIGVSAYIANGALSNFSPPPSGSGSSMASIANVFGLCILMGLCGWYLLKATGTPEGRKSVPASGEVRGDASTMASGGAPKPREIEQALLRRLEHLMAVERAYRREVTIGSLSAELGVPEYRLRQLINEGLGHRNFTAFLNRYRVEEAKAALADPEQSEVPVLTIAMDAGFQSIGPFNRAFRAATDLTPTEFRRLAMAKHAAVLPGAGESSGIGKPD